MSRPQDDNLIPGAHPLTVEEASKGGKASGESRRARKTMREYAESLLSCMVKDEKLTRQFQKLGVNPEKKGGYTFYEAMIIGQMAQAIKGSTAAYNAIKETVEPKTDGIGANIEDLTPLADLLGIKQRTEGDDEDDE